jgi:hypothetical protein
VIEAKNGKVGIQTNMQNPRAAIQLMTDAIVALAQEMVRKEKSSLVLPAGQLHRLPPL